MFLHPAQAQIAQSTSRFRVVNCGRRFGKTLLAAEEIKGKVLAKECRVCYIATTYQQARDIAWDILKKELHPIISNINESRLELRVKNIKRTESLVVLRGWESIETLRGQSFDFLIIDEVASLRNFESKWQTVLRPTLTDRKGEVLFLSTPMGFNHFYDLFTKQKEDTDYKSFHFTSYDNPHLPVEEIDKAKDELTPDRFAQEYLADFKKVEGLIWDIPDESIFNASNLAIKQAIAYPDHIIAGVDWGFRHPAAITVLKVKDGVYYVVDEWKGAGRTNFQIAEEAKRLKAKHGITIFYPDSAQPSAIEEFKTYGLPCGETSKDVATGLSHVAGLIRQQRLLIADHCAELLKEIMLYHYAPEVDGKLSKETPVKEFDDLCDSLRYALMGMRVTMPKSRADYLQLMSAQAKAQNMLNRKMKAQTNLTPRSYD